MATAFRLEDFVAAPPLEQAQAVVEGLPAKVLRELVADRTITLADLSRVIGPRRTIDRRLKEGERLSPDESDRLARFVTVLSLATGIFGDKARAMDWLTGPKRRFEGQAPIALLRTDAGTRLVEKVLQQARHGFTA